jgi:hypothetical protein
MDDNPHQEQQPYSPPAQTQAETERAADPQDMPARPRGGSLIWGVVLVVVGGLFLLQNISPFRLVNWWAIFILIPAIGSFVAAFQKYKADGRLSAPARGSLFGGLIFTTVAAIFLFNLDLGRYWPVFIIAAGLAVLANSLLPE